MKKENVKSYILFISAMLIFSTIGIFRRYIELSSGILACARGFMGAAVLIVYRAACRDKVFGNLSKKQIIILIASGIAMGFNWILLFEAYNFTTVATATLCYYMEPVIVILMSPLVLKEKLTAKKMICTATACAGMVMVSGILSSSDGDGSGLKGVMLGLGAAVLYSTVVLMNKVANADEAYSKTIIQLLSAAVVLAPYILLTEDFSTIVFTQKSVIMLLILGIIHTGIAYAMYFGSMSALKAQSIAVMSYIDPVFALISSVMFLDESMSPASIVGAVLIIGSALISEI